MAARAELERQRRLLREHLARTDALPLKIDDSSRVMPFWKSPVSGAEQLPVAPDDASNAEPVPAAEHHTTSRSLNTSKRNEFPSSRRRLSKIRRDLAPKVEPSDLDTSNDASGDALKHNVPSSHALDRIHRRGRSFRSRRAKSAGRLRATLPPTSQPGPAHAGVESDESTLQHRYAALLSRYDALQNVQDRTLRQLWQAQRSRAETKKLNEDLRSKLQASQQRVSVLEAEAIASRDERTRLQHRQERSTHDTDLDLDDAGTLHRRKEATSHTQLASIKAKLEASERVRKELARTLAGSEAALRVAQAQADEADRKMMLMAVAAAKATHGVPNVSNIDAAASEKAMHDITAPSGTSMNGSSRKLFTRADVAALTSLLSALTKDGDT